jgi:dolichyl-phosphate beta-glucosyltransferase
MVDLSVVVPAYNEEERLPRMLDETLDFLEARAKGKTKLPTENPYNSDRFTYEIIIVNDGSRDGTSQCADRYCKMFDHDKVRVITLEKNRGKGGAVRAGVLASRGNYIIFADADGASKFSDIEKLEKFMYHNIDSNLTVAIGSRAHMEEEAIASRSLFRTILMKGFHFLVWTCCVRTIRDTQCGFKMFNRNAALLLFKNYHNESWAFDVELLYLAEQLGCTMGEIAISWKEVDGSKIVPVFSWVRMGWDVVCLATLYNLGVYNVPHKEAIKSK